MSGALSADEAAAPASQKSVAKPAPEMNAMRVVRDTQTGELRAPTTEELKALQEAEGEARQARKPSPTPSSEKYAPDVVPAEKSIVRHANGMVSMRLSQDSLTAIKAVPDASGKPRIAHDDATTDAQPRAPEK
jgi:hypothetical protein